MALDFHRPDSGDVEECGFIERPGRHEMIERGVVEDHIGRNPASSGCFRAPGTQLLAQRVVVIRGC